MDDDGTRYEMRDGGWVEVDGEDWSEDEEGADAGDAGEGGEGGEGGGEAHGKGVAAETTGAAKEKEKKRKKKKKKTNDKWSEKAANEHNWV